MTQSAEQRKAKSEAFLAALDIPYNLWLPVIERVEEIDWPAPATVIERILALVYVAAKGEGVPPDALARLSARYAIPPKLTPLERDYTDALEVDAEANINATWWYEAIAALMWTAGMLDELPFPTTVIDVPAMLGYIAKRNEADLKQAAKYRDFSEILDNVDLYYRLHWACVDASLNRRMIPARLHAGIIYYRLYAFNWLVGYGKDWDSISVDS